MNIKLFYASIEGVILPIIQLILKLAKTHKLVKNSVSVLLLIEELTPPNFVLYIIDALVLILFLFDSAIGRLQGVCALYINLSTIVLYLRVLYSLQTKTASN